VEEEGTTTHEVEILALSIVHSYFRDIHD